MMKRGRAYSWWNLSLIDLFVASLLITVFSSRLNISMQAEFPDSSRVCCDIIYAYRDDEADFAKNGRGW